MCVGPFAPQSSKMPDLPPPPPPVEAPPRAVDANVQVARDKQRRRAAAATGNRSTFLTGAGGVTAPATTTGKSLLGQ